MADDVILNKVAMIERCVARAREEHAAAGDRFLQDFTRQDAAVLNVQRACEAALDLGQHLVRRERLGLPQGSRDIFDILQRQGWIDAALSTSMKKMVGFRNIAVHDYQHLVPAITEEIIRHHLDDFLRLAATVLARDAAA